MTTREAEVQKAREWLITRKPQPPKRPTIVELEAILATDDRIPVEINADGSVGVCVLDKEAVSHAAYVAHSLRVELGELAKEMCWYCKEGASLLVDRGECMHRWNGKVKCKSAPIRRRIAELEEEGTNAD